LGDLAGFEPATWRVTVC